LDDLLDTDVTEVGGRDFNEDITLALSVELLVIRTMTHVAVLDYL